MSYDEDSKTILSRSCIWLLILLLSAGWTVGGVEEKVDPKILEEITQNGETRFIVYMKEKADLNAAHLISDWSRRGFAVYYALRQTAEKTQAPIIDLLNQKMMVGRIDPDLASYWICNCLAANGDRETVLELAARPDVERLTANRKMQVLEPMEISEEPGGVVTALEWNVAQIRAHEVWNTYGITGFGITIGHMDTGVQWNHPALVRQYRGLLKNGLVDHNYNWFDATPAMRREPYDSSNHGTHTMGTILGDDGAGAQIGVAPGAKWISTLTIGRDLSTFIESTHRGFQFMLAPTDLDGQNADPDKRPVAVNNSWGCIPGLWGCVAYELFWDDVNAWISAGIVPQFAAGNEGPRVRSCRYPGDYPQSFTTGSTDRNDVIAGNSSRGPSQFDDSVKPNVSAPGVNIRSSVPPNAYGLNSGTSMAGPHIVGLIAMLLEANPYLNTTQLQEIIQYSAVPLGEGQPNNVYGWGRIDAMAAVEWALILLPR